MKGQRFSENLIYNWTLPKVCVILYYKVVLTFFKERSVTCEKKVFETFYNVV